MKKEPPSSVRLNVNDLIGEMITLIQASLHGVTLRIELMDELPYVSADHIQLKQVLLNLMTNAMDSMKDVTSRPRELRIRTRIKQSANRTGDNSGFGGGPESNEYRTTI